MLWVLGEGRLPSGIYEFQAGIEDLVMLNMLAESGTSVSECGFTVGIRLSHMFKKMCDIV